MVVLGLEGVERWTQKTHGPPKKLQRGQTDIVYPPERPARIIKDAVESARDADSLPVSFSPGSSRDGSPLRLLFLTYHHRVLPRLEGPSFVAELGLERAEL